MTLSVRIRKAQPLLPVVGELLKFAREQLVKAALPPAIAAREELFAEVQPAMAAELIEYFEGILTRAGVTKDVAFPFDPDGVDWEAEEARLTGLLEIWYVLLGDAALAALGQQLGLAISFDIEAPWTAGVRHLIGVHVTSITATLRQQLRNRVEEAIARGLSVDQLVAGTADFEGLRELFGSRAHVIALTETATAYNAASLAGYGESGLVDQVEVFDGPDCGWTEHDDEDLADRSIRTLEEASAYTTAHPNCQRAFGPVVVR